MRYGYLILIVVLAAAIVLFRTHISGGQPPLPPEQKEAVAALLDVGGVLLHCDDRLPGNPIVLVDFTNHPEFRDALLKHVTAFPDLRNLGLAGTALSDTGLDDVARLTRLESLTLNDTAVTDAGLAKLSGCKNLKVLDVRGTKVSAGAIAKLHDALPAVQISSDAGGAVVAKVGATEATSQPTNRIVATETTTPPRNGTAPPDDRAVRFRAADAAALREKASELAAVPESAPEGWSKSAVDPNRLLTLFPALRIRQGFTLRAYQFKSEGNGNAVVWAMPVDAEYPEPKDCPRLEGHLFKAPKPYDALDDVMDAIEGNDTAEAYWQASLLRRELKDFGAIWHGVAWGTHVIVEDDPSKFVRDENADPLRTPSTKPDEWTWLEAKPTNWTPRVMLEADRAVVTFYTFSGYEKEGLYRHVDVYRRGKYRPRVEEPRIAEGKGGYLF